MLRKCASPCTLWPPDGLGGVAVHRRLGYCARPEIPMQPVVVKRVKSVTGLPRGRALARARIIKVSLPSVTFLDVPQDKLEGTAQ